MPEGLVQVAPDAEIVVRLYREAKDMLTHMTAVVAVVDISEEPAARKMAAAAVDQIM